MTQSETLAETAAVARFTPPAPQPASRRLTALVAAIAVALGLVAGSAVPARADGGDLAKALAAIAVVGLIASAAKAKDDEKQRERDRKAREKKAREEKKREATRTVPAACAIEIAGTRTSATVYAESCMTKRRVAHLPVWCARPATILGQRDFIYTESCLREGGLRLPSRR